MNTHTPQIYQGHTYTYPPNIPGGHTHSHTHSRYTRDTHPKYTRGTHIHLTYTKDRHRETASQPHTHRHTHTRARAPFPLVPASGRGWGVGPPTPVTHEAAAARGPLGGSLTLSLERKHVTAWSGGPVVPSQAKPWEGLLPHSRDVLISFCRQRKWRRGT